MSTSCALDLTLGLYHGTLEAPIVAENRMASQSVIERLDAEVNDFVERCLTLPGRCLDSQSLPRLGVAALAEYPPAQFGAQAQDGDKLFGLGY